MSTTASSLHGLGHGDDFIQPQNEVTQTTSGSPFQYSPSNFQMIQRAGQVWLSQNLALVQRPPRLGQAILCFPVSHSQPGPTPGLAWELANRPHKCPAERLPSSLPPLAHYLPAGFSHDFLAGLLPPLFVGQLYQLGCWCVQSQVLPLFG